MGDNTTHAELSPSKRHRWGVCPGSIRLEAQFPEPPNGSAAIDGTRTHAILEQAINKRQKRIEKRFVGSTAKDEHGEYKWDADRIERVNLALDYIWSRAGSENAVSEQRVYPDGLLGRDDCSGTVDCQIPGDFIYEIIDYKDGMAPVEVVGNLQLELYAVGVLAGMEPSSYPQIIRATVIQPKLALKGMPVITSWDIPVPELLQRIPAIVDEAKATDDPNAPLVPGESQCKYCRAKATCPAIAGKVMQELNVMFQAIPEVLPAADSSLDVAQQAASKDPATMDNHQLRQILEAAPLVRQLLEGVEKEVQRRLEDGQEVPGFKLVRGRGSRSWSLPDDEIAKKLKAMGVPKESLFETKVISPAKVEKLSWEKNGETQTLSERQLKRIETEYIAKNAGKITVAPEADPRESVVLNAAPMFAAIETKVEEVAPMPAWLSVPDWLK